MTILLPTIACRWTVPSNLFQWNSETLPGGNYVLMAHTGLTAIIWPSLQPAHKLREFNGKKTRVLLQHGTFGRRRHNISLGITKERIGSEKIQMPNLLKVGQDQVVAMVKHLETLIFQNHGVVIFHACGAEIISNSLPNSLSHFTTDESLQGSILMRKYVYSYYYYYYYYYFNL